MIGLFQAYGIEIEHMIVDRQTLDVRPWADRLLTDAAGELVSDFEDGPITWSNELVSHVIEFKTSSPAPSLAPLAEQFYESQRRAADLLSARGARLMPTGMHPWMDPLRETVLWPHDNNEIYSLYNTIFDCRGHGWSNLQSVHINLPFANETEFRRLHSAIRALLPIIPALSASTPIFESRLSDDADSRLAFYETNQRRLPIIAGDIVPPPVLDFADYRTKITDPIQDAVRPFDPAGLLRGDWLNSRGAIARIDRGTIEIRLVDTQECATADLAIARLIVDTLRSLTEDSDFLARADQLDTRDLHKIYRDCVHAAELAPISDTAYINLLAGSPSKDRTARELWRDLVETRDIAPKTDPTALEVLALPSLATRIRQALAPAVPAAPRATPRTSMARPAAASPPALPRERIFSVYEALCDCVDQNRIFSS